MKKYLMTFAAAVCCAMSATMFTACGDDDNSSSSGTGGGGTVSDTVRAYVAASVTFKETEDILKYCDVTVKYNDGTGEKTDTLKSTEWNKVLSAKLPGSLTYKKIVTLRDSAGMAAKDSISFSGGYSYAYCFYNAAKERIDDFKTFNMFGNPKKTAKIAQFIEYIKAGRLNTTVDLTFNAKGEWVDQSETVTPVDSTATKPTALR